MTTIIRASGMTFNNPNLPTISPFVTNGLLAAFRPNNSKAGLLDLSGNGHKLVFDGAPTLTDKSMIGDGKNGLLTDVAETKDFTILAISRIYRNQYNNFDGFVVTTFADLDGNDKDRGSGMFYGQSQSNGKMQVGINDQVFAKRLNDGSYQNRYFVTDVAEMAATGTTSDVTPVNFHAFAVDTQKRQMIAYNMGKQSTPTNFSDEAQQGYDAGQRLLYDPATGQRNFYRLVSNPNYSRWVSKIEIFEVLIYNRALSQDEIMRQYQYSKEFMQKHRGIAI